MDPALLPLIRGTHEGADCSACPFSKDGLPNRPVYGEWPDDPAWIVIGEGPGFNETRLKRPFVGASGEVLNKILAKIGRPRHEIAVTNATLCQPYEGADDQVRQRAATACSNRLRQELAQFPAKPVLTLGAVAARSVIPKATLDAIDPPDAPKAIRKAQKLRQQPTLKLAIARRKAIDKLTKRKLEGLIKHHRQVLIGDAKRQRRKPDEAWLAREVVAVQGKLSIRAKELAIKDYDSRAKQRTLQQLERKSKPAKPKKPKPIKITDIVGTLFDVDVDGSGVRPVIPAIHPAALLRGGGASIAGSHTPDMAFVNLIWDARKIDQLAKGKDVRLRLNIKYEIEDADRAIRLFLDVLHDAMVEGACSLDLETYVDDPDRHSALMAYVAKIRVIGLATKTQSVSLLWDLLPDWCRVSLLQLLLVSVEMTYHNGLYDRTVLRAYGFEMGPSWFDSLLAHHAAFPGNSHKLQVVASQFYGIEPWKSEFRNAEETPDKLAAYNAKDTGATHALRIPLSANLKATKTEQVYEIDKMMSDMASRMHLAGMPVDRDINQELLTTFSKNVVESRRAVEDIARDPKLREQIWHHLAISQAGKKRKLDPPDFEERYQIRLSAMRLDPDWKWKIGSGKHIAALLQAMGVALYQTTDKGEISTKKDVLESLTDVPIVRDILNYRENDKLYSTFVYPIFDRYDALGNIVQYGFADPGNRIHPIWNVHRISGRWASSWPVVSNVPKDKWKKLLGEALLILAGVQLPPKGALTLPDGTVVRVNKDKTVSKLVRPNLRRQIKCRPGRKIVGFDYEQIEARVIALISGDSFMCEIFSSGRDIHIECARIIFDAFDAMDPDTQKQVREQTKPIEYGFMYLAQVETLYKQLLKEGFNIKLVDLAKAVARLAQAMAGVIRWQQGAVRRASQPPYEIRDYVLGRRRVWPMGQAEPTEACNSEVQPTAAAIMNSGMARFMRRSIHKYRELLPLAQVHDAAYFEVWEDDVDRLAADINNDFMHEETRDGRTLRFPVNIKIGDSWDQV